MRLRLPGMISRIEATLPRWRDDSTALIQPYPGHATPDTLIAIGRALARPVATDRVISSFRTRELAGIRIVAQGAEAVTDKRGYFTLRLPRNGQEGWITIPVRLGSERAVLPVMVPRADARFGIISDIDDTLMQTGAWSLPRNLWTTLRGRPDSRHIFPDAVSLMDRLHEGGRNPVFYVSSGPWHLLPFLEEVFRINGLPRGPMFLRDWHVSRNHLIAIPQRRHKAAAIDTILAANPDMPFILLGDTGQHDAEIYREAATRHPGRIIGVTLRRAGPVDPGMVAETFVPLGIAAAVVTDFDDHAAAQDNRLGQSGGAC